MDKNQITGIILMVVLYVGYIWYSTPSEEERNAAIAEQERLVEEARKDSLLLVEEEAFQATLRQEEASALSTADTEAMDPKLEQRFGSLAMAAVGQDQTFELGNENLTVQFTSRGGTPYVALLPKYNRYGTEEPVILWEPDQSEVSVLFDFDEVNRPLSLNEFHFEVERQTKDALVLVASNDAGKSIRWQHTLIGNSLDSDLSFEGFGYDLGDEFALAWTAQGVTNEKGLEWERQHSSIYYKEDDRGRNYLNDGRADEFEAETALEWVAFKQNFFSAIVSTPEGFLAGSKLTTTVPEEDSTVTMQYAALLPFEATEMGGQSGATLNFYFGPNEQNTLVATGWTEVDRIIDYGWWIFGWVNRNAILPLYQFLSQHFVSAGIIILIITLIIKLALTPITWKNFMSSAKMRVLRPEIDALTEKHGDDAMGKQQATMALYRQTGVNPLAGCLPGLLQMPILYAMFRFFPANIDMRGQSFLWADDLGAFDSILDLPFSIPFYGAHVSGFTILMAASTFFYMRMTMANQPPQPQQPGMPNMKVIQQMFPFMMLFFFNRFASGLSLYYLAANIISMGQMLAIKAFLIDEDKIRAKIEENKAKPKKKSGFQERLEQMQKEQAAKTKDIKEAKKGRKK
ncbi:membrane protein insertase YidC [bacterium]|jgi:YidC/Oxa1 family membrane protein insertase|nr:membrane protein insertase YidC [Flavobacteriales bacterium]MDC3198327.1 membrane protein insertase YidC [bacterium]